MKIDYSKYTIIREEEYKALSKMILNGSILDLGGSNKAGYQELIGGEHKFVTVNFDEAYGCDLVFDIEKKFPMEDGVHSHVISLNVLEHIYNFHNVINESFRVLKKDGSVLFITPFFFQIHGSPDDYFRYTESALLRAFKEAGFVDIEIKKISYGLFSALYQVIGGGIRPLFIKEALKKFSIGLDNFIARLSPRYERVKSRIPIGFILTARKS